MKLIIVAVLLSLAFSPAVALDNSVKKWSRCELDCDNAGGEPFIVKICKERCKETPKNATRKGTKGTMKPVDQDTPVLMQDN